MSCYVWQHEEVFVVDLSCKPVSTFVGEVARIEFLIHDEVKRFDGLGHFPVVVLHVYLLGLEHSRLYSLF